MSSRIITYIVAVLFLLSPVGALAYGESYYQGYYQGGYTLTGMTPAQNASLGINKIGNHYISSTNGSAQLFDGLMSDVYFVDGQALGPTSFGAFDGNGFWKPGYYGGALGYNGFHLDFANSGFTDFSPSNGTVKVGPLTQTTNYRLICTAADIGSIIETNTTVSVQGGTGLTLTACDTSGNGCSSSSTTPAFVQSGQAPALSWNAVGFDSNSCNVTYPGGTVVPANTNSATNTVPPAINAFTTYTLSCNLGGSPNSTTVGVGIKQNCLTGVGAAGNSCSSQCALMTDTLQVQPGGSATVSWCCPSGPSAATNFATGGLLSGTVSVAPSSNTTYSLTCPSGNGSISLTALKPPALLTSFSATRVRAGGQSLLSWTVARMAEDMTCNISPAPAGPQPSGSAGTWLGSTLTPPVFSPTVYTLTCGSDNAGYVSATATAGLLPTFKEK